VAVLYNESATGVKTKRRGEEKDGEERKQLASTLGRRAKKVRAKEAEWVITCAVRFSSFVGSVEVV
jgi:hypothetical protein